MLAAADKIGRLITGGPLERYSYIAPHLIIGGQPANRVWEKMIVRGVTGVINLRREYSYELRIDKQRVRYLHLPTADNEAPSLEQLSEGVRFIREIVAQQGKVYIHCWEGLGRGPTMAAAYFVSEGMSPDEALTCIRRVRPFIRPTPSQIARLQEFAQLGIEGPHQRHTDHGDDVDNEREQ